MQSDLELARAATLAGAAVGLRYFAALADLPRELKADGSVVTEADRAVEAAIRAVLTEGRPGDAILGEEGGATGDGARRWIIDPIDGTAQFVAGDDRWLVLVALEEAGEIVAGVAAVPAQGGLWWARRGGGAFAAKFDGTGERRLRAGGGRATIAESRVGVIPVAPNLTAADEAIAAPLGAVASIVDWDVHAALLVADGTLDLALQTRGQIWDFAATALIVEEAGGCYGGADGIRGPRPGVSLFAADRALWGAAHAALWPA
ncbi:inositol monophosphatase family protein [Amorphoplanes digitatis]|uniref:Histidinol-phosphatase n=1 Tax=Actinoplanes digitatis TaxID=1868 RepID=A0A7W7HX52_9ACTN|nr:inositol monophosphatase family protein [Actinoplanes digitatis]MBB4762348.1 histidinol-phosphatase [Actinoplanes digitatis]GID92530.1 histidinol-phosphatase [Actinoplanes digitatis]